MEYESSGRCPRCGEGRLLRWHELNEEEQMLARRLPASADYELSERQQAHRWCNRCWYEETQSMSVDV